jgi:hypothetical protein
MCQDNATLFLGLRQCCPLMMHSRMPSPAARRGKTNFFEKRVGDYQKSGVMAGLQGSLHNFQLDADF